MFERGKWWVNPITGEIENYEEPKRVIAPVVRGDEMPPTINHADGRVYTSRAAFNAATKASGFEEMTFSELKMPSVREAKKADAADIKADTERAYYLARDNMAPLSEKEKELCRRANEGIKNN